MEKDSVLYQLMDVRMNGVMNDIVSSDGEYQEITRRSDIYSGQLERMELPEEVRHPFLKYKSLPPAPRTCWILTTAGAS